jgi:hypothetical protein
VRISSRNYFTMLLPFSVLVVAKLYIQNKARACGGGGGGCQCHKHKIYNRARPRQFTVTRRFYSYETPPDTRVIPQLTSDVM